LHAHRVSLRFFATQPVFAGAGGNDVRDAPHLEHFGQWLLKIRAVVCAEAGEARRSIFHSHALEALQAADAPPAELAYHAQAAGLAEPAFHWSLAAGDEAMRVVAVSSAISFYEQARHLMTERLHGL
jgi:hypothetical protein